MAVPLPAFPTTADSCSQNLVLAVKVEALVPEQGAYADTKTYPGFHPHLGNDSATTRVCLDLAMPT